MKLVKTGDKITRNGEKYDVIIADDNIFVLCKFTDENTVNYDFPEVYANQSEINTLEDLKMSIV